MGGGGELITQHQRQWDSDDSGAAADKTSFDWGGQRGEEK